MFLFLHSLVTRVYTIKLCWEATGGASESCVRAHLTRNNLGLSSCTVPQSAVVCVVMYFRKTELLPGAQKRSGILIRVRIKHVKDVNL